ncbi:MAG: epoxyqueuosine reductase [Deltaproteobacteria bacterium]|nr:epoxyqueuosine reductase [Deltaproteobacteria bacterium]MBW2119307.1 epoxyqueuosine reductase [Deltaproteobacteria bacterium]MBW2345448.1 epoxyqueuosine reductase [Deltaproteobacteria bacterium]
MKDKSVALDYTEKIKDRIIGLGADLVGIADVEPLKDLKVDPPDLLDPFTRAVSIALKLPKAVFEEISDQPTPIYKSIYLTANLTLDQIAFRTAMALQDDGHYSLPVPASQVLDQENWYAAISHKAVARMAGLGWQGKNLLLITPKYGSRVRLVTVLTKAPLDVDGPIKNRCGDCNACKDACPAQAIKGVNIESHYKSRNEAMYFSRCREKVVGEFAKIPEVGVPICGICIKACPFGKKLTSKKATPTIMNS